MGKKKSIVRLNWELWFSFNDDMEKLSELIKEENYGMAKQRAVMISVSARNSSDLLGGQADMLSEPALPPDDERRLAWGELARGAGQLGELLRKREYEQAEKHMRSLLKLTREYMRRADAAYKTAGRR